MLCRTKCKSLRLRYNTLRDYIACFYGEEFEEWAGEKLLRRFRTEQWDCFFDCGREHPRLLKAGVFL